MRHALKLVSQGVSKYVRPRLAAGGTMYSVRPFVRSFKKNIKLVNKIF